MKKEGKLKQLEKEVNKLKRQPETKVYTFPFSFTNMDAGSSTGSVLTRSINPLAGISQGLDTLNRIGNKITLKSIEVSGMIDKELDAPAACRLLLHKSKEQLTTQGNVGQFIFPIGGTSGTPLTYNENDDPLQRWGSLNHKNHTKILERTINIPQSQLTTNINAVPFKIIHNFKDAPYVYANDTVYGKTNTMYLTGWNSSAAIGQRVRLQGVYTIKYRDE